MTMRSTVPATICVLLLAGCLTAQPGSETDHRTTPPTDQPPTSDPVYDPGTRNPNIVLALNRTGDLALQFTVRSQAMCKVSAVAGFTRDGGREPSMMFGELTSGAHATWSPVGIAVRGPGINEWDGEGKGSGDAWFWVELSGQIDEGAQQYVAGVRNMTWMPNKYTSEHSFLAQVQCDGPFTVEDIRGSREVHLMNAWTLEGGVAVVDSMGQVIADASWSRNLKGDHGRLVAFPGGISHHTNHITWSTPTESFGWDPTDRTRVVVLDGPAGAYSVAVDFTMRGPTDGRLFTMAANLPPVDPVTLT